MPWGSILHTSLPESLSLLIILAPDTHIAFCVELACVELAGPVMGNNTLLTP